MAVWAVGVGCGYVAPSWDLVKSRGLAVLGCGSGWIRVGALAGLGGCDGCGLGLGVIGRSGARSRVRWRPSASGSFGVFNAASGVAPHGGGCWATGLGGGAAGWGSRASCCFSPLGSWGAVGAAGVSARTLVGW